MPTNLHVPDYLILPFGKAVKSDLQKISLSAVSADGLYFSTNVPIIFIRKADRRPLSLGSDFERYFGEIPLSDEIERVWNNDYDHEAHAAVLDYMCDTVKSHNPNITKYEEAFLDLYFGTMKTLAKKDWKTSHDIGFRYAEEYKSKTDLWRALLPIPELQLYVQDPLAETVSYQPDNNFRVDYGFWTGEKLVAVEIDGAEPEGYARDIRRDRLLRRAGVDVIHILNLELLRHKTRALVQLLPHQFFGLGWDYEGEIPSLPF
jgi:hypothetical protein